MDFGLEKFEPDKLHKQHAATNILQVVLSELQEAKITMHHTVAAKKGDIFVLFRPVQTVSHCLTVHASHSFSVPYARVQMVKMGMVCRCVKMESQLIRLPTRIYSFILPQTYSFPGQCSTAAHSQLHIPSSAHRHPPPIPFPFSVYGFQSDCSTSVWTVRNGRETSPYLAATVPVILDILVVICISLPKNLLLSMVALLSLRI